MKLDDLIAHHVAGTTLTPASVKRFFRTPPHYHHWGQNRQIDQISLDQLDATDLFEFYLRLYLVGRHKTLRAVRREVRIFAQQYPNGAHHLINFSMENMRRSLLGLEWYELMPRLKHAKKMILLGAPDPDYLLRPLLVKCLEDSY